MPLRNTLTTILLSCILGFQSITAYGQHFQEQVLQTKISSVTLFLEGAQVFESGTATLPTGNVSLIVKGLSPFIDPASIQVRGTGAFTILSVNHRTDFLGEKNAHAQIDSLQHVIETLTAEKEVIDARLAVLKELQDVLKANRQLNTESSTAHIAEQLVLYEQHLGKMKTEEISLNTQKKKIDEHVARIVNQLNTLRDTKTESKGEIEVRVSSEQPVSAELEITYLVANAGWYPKYDIRVANVDSPLELTYRAAAYQRTGVDWKDVRLRFSNADPRQGATAAVLTPWRLNYAQQTILQSQTRMTRPFTGNQISGRIMDENNEPLISANVMVHGTSIGTITDLNGYYTLSLPQGATHIVVSYVGYSAQVVAISAAIMDVRLMAGVVLDQVQVIGSRTGATNYYIDGMRASGNLIPQQEVAPLLTTMIENQTTVEIEVDIPYSMLSSPELLTIDLQKHEIEVSYEYYAVPKLEQHAYLVARATGWDRYNLLEGEANLYFEDAYVGRTIIDAKSMRDTLDISLGRDRNIVIGRIKNDEYKQVRLIGTNAVESRGFDILVRNKKSQAIHLTITDQIPIPVISTISVKELMLSGGTLDAESGLVTWKLDLQPGTQKELVLQYEVKYPRGQRVMLE